jgi:hypothetical protein
MHGYHPDDEYSDGVFLANARPAIEPQSIADVHGYLAASAGLDIRTTPRDSAALVGQKELFERAQAPR